MVARPTDRTVPMTGTAWGAIVTLAIFVLSNIAALIYWSARISTLLDVVQKQLKDLSSDLKGMRELYMTKESFAYRVSQSDKEHAAMWKQLDALTGKK